MKLTITEKHLDAALARPWDTKTCLVAQAIAEHFKEQIVACGHGSTVFASNKEVRWHDSTHISREFDSAFAVDKEHPDPTIIANLRAKLPIDFEVEEWK